MEFARILALAATIVGARFEQGSAGAAGATQEREPVSAVRPTIRLPSFLSCNFLLRFIDSPAGVIVVVKWDCDA